MSRSPKNSGKSRLWTGSDSERWLVLVESPLQLRNAVSLVEQSDRHLASCLFILKAYGVGSAVRQMLQAGAELKLKGTILLVDPQPEGVAAEEIEGFLGQNKLAIALRLPLGRPALGRLRALMWAGTVFPQGSWLTRRKFSKLVVGNAGQVTPLLPLFLERASEIFFVDDGLSTLELGERRRKIANNPRPLRIPKVLLPPLFWHYPITVFTLFQDLRFGAQDSVVFNKRFENLRSSVRVQRNLIWIVGSPFVEKGGMAFDGYKAILEELAQTLRRYGSTIRYMPHRLENPAVTRTLLAGLSIESEEKQAGPVEEWVITHRATACVVVGFSSTALEILAQLTPATCAIYNVRVQPPLSKSGADSPQAIADRFQRNPRIKSLALRTVKDLGSYNAN